MLAAAVRFALAILCNAGTFILWDLGTRSPGRLAADGAGALRSPAAFLRGAARFAGGVVLLGAAVVIAIPAIPTPRAFAILETVFVLAGLFVEACIGADVRRRAGQTSR